MKKRILSMFIAVLMVVLMIPFSALSVFAAEEKMQISTIVMDVRPDVGAKRLTAAQIFFNDDGNDEYAEYHKRVEIKNGEVTWLKGDKFGEEMGAEETYVTDTNYYLKFTLIVKEEFQATAEFGSGIIERVFGQRGTAGVEVYQESKTSILVTMKVGATVPKVTINIPNPEANGTMTFADLSEIVAVDEKGYYDFESVSSWYTGNDYRYDRVRAFEKEGTELITHGNYCAEIIISEKSSAVLAGTVPIEIQGVEHYEITYVSNITIGTKRALSIYITVDTRERLTSVPIAVTEPIAGELPVAPAMPDGAVLESYTWKSSYGYALPTGYKFVSGETYTVIMRVGFNEAYLFENNATVTINGEVVNYRGDLNGITIEYSLTTPGEKRGFDVNGSLSAPVGGQTPSDIMVDANDYVMFQSGGWTGEFDDGKFVCGKEYTYTFLLYPQNGYKFNEDPTVVVNGQLAIIETRTNDYVRCVIKMMSNDSISVTDPKCGETPATPVVNDPRLSYSFHTWFDKAENTAISGNFAAGKTYVLQVDVTSTTENLAFDYWKTIMINGQVATRSSFALDGKSASYTIEFVESSVVIDEFDIMISRPVAGQVPSTTIIDPSDRIELESAIIWSPADATFVEGKEYTLILQIKAKDGYAFSAVDIDKYDSLLDALNAFNASCKINGVQAKTINGASVGSNPTALTLIHTFICAPAHTHTISETCNAYDGTSHWKECTDSDCPDKFFSRTDVTLHSVGTDDGDCTTAITCAHCSMIMAEGAATHTAGADDGDCTTAVKCVDCDKIAIEAKAAHVDADTNGKCDTCGKDMPKANDPSAPTPDLPNTNTDKETNATDATDDESKSDDETDAPVEKGCGGCGSSAAISAVALVGVIGTALVIKKKED